MQNGMAFCTSRVRKFSHLFLISVVIEGKDLKAMDVGGSSDPFVVISYGPQSFRTSIVNRSVTPVWNEVWAMLLMCVDLFRNFVYLFISTAKDGTLFSAFTTTTRSPTTITSARPL